MNQAQVNALKDNLEQATLDYLLAHTAPSISYKAAVFKLFAEIKGAYGEEGYHRADNFREYLTQIIDPDTDPNADLKLLILLDAVITEESTKLKNEIFLKCFGVDFSLVMSQSWRRENKGRLFRELVKIFIELPIDTNQMFHLTRVQMEVDKIDELWLSELAKDRGLQFHKFLDVFIWEILFKKFNLSKPNLQALGLLIQNIKYNLIKDIREGMSSAGINKLIDLTLNKFTLSPAAQH